MSQRIPVTELTPDFRGRAEEALADGQLRNNFRVAMDSLMTKRANAFPDADEREGLRELGNRIKAGALSRLPDLLECGRVGEDEIGHFLLARRALGHDLQV